MGSLVIPLNSSPRLPARVREDWAVASGSQPRPPARPPPDAQHRTPLPAVSTHPRDGGWLAAALLNLRAHLHGPAPLSDTLARAGPSPLPLGRSF